jgi:FkbH-like protein
MVLAQLEREVHRNRSSREEFLGSIDLRVNVFELLELSDKRFPRALELINKTNQFNTTGKRRSHEECAKMLSGGGRFFAFEVQDRFTEYGLTGIVIMDGAHIEQFVMSCRVVGLDAEVAALSEIVLSRLGGNEEPIMASFVPTERNLLARDFFARCGFTQENGEWRVLRKDVARCPGHIRLAVKTPGEDGGSTHASAEFEISRMTDPIG